MTMFITILATVAAGTVLATSAFAQSAREIRGADPYFAIEKEPAPKLIDAKWGQFVIDPAFFTKFVYEGV